MSRARVKPPARLIAFKNNKAVKVNKVNKVNKVIKNFKYHKVLRP